MSILDDCLNVLGCACPLLRKEINKEGDKFIFTKIVDPGSKILQATIDNESAPVNPMPCFCRISHLEDLYQDCVYSGCMDIFRESVIKNDIITGAASWHTTTSSRCVYRIVEKFKMVPSLQVIGYDELSMKFHIQNFLENSGSIKIFRDLKNSSIPQKIQSFLKYDYYSCGEEIRTHMCNSMRWISLRYKISEMKYMISYMEWNYLPKEWKYNFRFKDLYEAYIGFADKERTGRVNSRIGCIVYTMSIVMLCDKLDMDIESFMEMLDNIKGFYILKYIPLRELYKSLKILNNTIDEEKLETELLSEIPSHNTAKSARK